MTWVFVTFIASFLVIIWAGKMLPRALSGIALILHLPEFIVAFILVAAATSLPELFVGISSALRDVSTLSLGNIFGANLANLTFILGVAALLAKEIRADKEMSAQNFWLTAVVVFLPVFLAVDGVISRVDGAILLAAFALYLIKIFRNRNYFHKISSHKAHEPRGTHSLGNILRHSSAFLVGALLLVGGSFALIWAAERLATAYFSSNFFLFGVLFLALGTTLPEFMFALRAALSKQTGAILGDALGTTAFNAGGVIGIVALLRPIEYTLSREGVVAVAALLLAFALLYLFMYTGKTLRRSEAAVLIALYAAFVALTLL